MTTVSIAPDSPEPLINLPVPDDFPEGTTAQFSEAQTTQSSDQAAEQVSLDLAILKEQEARLRAMAAEYEERFQSQQEQLKAVEAKYEERIQEIVQRQQLIEQRMEEMEAREVFMQRQLLELKEKQERLQECLEKMRLRNEFFRYNVESSTYFMVNAREMHVFFSRLLVGLWEEDEDTLNHAIDFLDQIHRN
jgi:DNA gyrase/topoisomerase IV subunit A